MQKQIAAFFLFSALLLAACTDSPVIQVNLSPADLPGEAIEFAQSQTHTEAVPLFNWQVENQGSDNVTYMGSAQIRGWIFEELGYGNTPRNFFKIHPDDASFLPVAIKSEIFNIDGNSSIEDFAETSPENPSTIKIFRIRTNMESPPTIYVQ